MEFQGSEQVQAMVERARLVQTPTGSEMHVGLRTDALGQINVHAVVRDSATGPVSVGATIAVQDHETRALLVRELPALQGHLQERNIRLDEIAVIPESLASGAGLQQQQAGSSPDAQRQQQQRAQLGAADSPVTPESDAPPAAAIWTPGDGRLSVRA